MMVSKESARRRPVAGGYFEVLGKIDTVDVARHYETDRYHLKGIGM